MSRFTVVLDACVLYPALLRTPKKYNREKLEQTRDLMNLHAKDALVTGYEYLIEQLELPDPDDRHVLAAAMRMQLLP